MRWKTCSTALLVAGSLTSILLAAEPQNAPGALASVRRALGGDATLNAIGAVTVNARYTGGPAGLGTLEFAYALPNKFLRVTRTTVGTPVATHRVALYDGFNGDSVIRDRETGPDAGPTLVLFPADPEPATPAEATALRERFVAENKRVLAEFLLPLFATSLAAYPITFTPDPHVVPGGPFDVVEARGVDGFTWRIFIDAGTHLPAKLTWLAPKYPPVLARTSSDPYDPGNTTTATPASNPYTGSRITNTSVPAPMPPLHAAIVPPANRPATGSDLVSWELSLSDYRTAGGVRWPHRWVVSRDGALYQDVRLGEYSLNAKIPDKTFRPTR
jgi:hypothetical protein